MNHKWCGTDNQFHGSDVRELIVAMLMLVVVLLVFGITSLNAQTAAGKVAEAQSLPMPDWQKAAGGRKEFEVASVRASRLGAPLRGIEQLLQLDVAPPRGGLFSANAPLSFYISFAFKIEDTSQDGPVRDQLPDWAQITNFDIEARSEDGSTRDQLRLMFQSLLEDRFKLAMHTEVRQRPVYALVLGKQGKPGPQLLPHPEDESCVVRPDHLKAVTRITAKRPLFCGMDEWQTEDGKFHLRMVNVTMDQAASYLSSTAAFYGGMGSRPFLDRTGLTGHFDLNLEFMPRNSDPSLDSADDAAGLSFVDAIKRQLGLKLIEQIGSVTVYVIDHVEMPSAN